MFTEEQILSVTANASGIDLMSASSPALNPFCTSAEYPPMKFTPQVSAALCKAFANFSGSPPGQAAALRLPRAKGAAPGALHGVRPVVLDLHGSLSDPDGTRRFGGVKAEKI